MKILIANDDGIGAPGLEALSRAFAGAGHEVIVCAPDGQRSAASHSVTLTADFPVKRASCPGAVRAYAVGGTPVDCVRIALHVLEPDVQFVLSGINRGYNVGTDVLYSGTVGSAMEGTLAGLPAMAVSLGKESSRYDMAAQEALSVFGRLQECGGLPEKTMLNLNIPETERILGRKATSLRWLRYDDCYVLSKREDQADWYHLEGWLDKTDPAGDDDLSWLQKGFASLTVLSYDLADHPETEALGRRIAAD